jgi:hypothetical protein
MGRKTKPIEIKEEGRDKGKVFVIKEMSARGAFKWGCRALSAMSRSGVPMPPNIEGTGLLGVAAIGIRGIFLADPDEIEPLLDKVMSECIRFAPSKEPELTRLVNDDLDDIEEVATVIFLYMEVLDLHVGFSVADALSKLASAKTTTDQN